MRFINVGFQNYVNVDEIDAVTIVSTQPIRKRIKQADESSSLIDCTRSRKTRSAIFLKSGQIVLSHKNPEVIVDLISGKGDVPCE